MEYKGAIMIVDLVHTKLIYSSYKVPTTANSVEERLKRILKDYIFVKTQLVLKVYIKKKP